MPETYGLPEPEPTRQEQAQFIVNEVVAGQSVVRRVILYAIVGIALLVPQMALFAIPALIMLCATDKSLA